MPDSTWWEKVVNDRDSGNRLTCLICGTRGNDLVRMQEHVMHEHGYKHDDHQKVTRRREGDSYIWTMPDGTDWLSSTSC